MSAAAPGQAAPPEPQLARTVVMVRPAAFGFNDEAARSNAFAHRLTLEDCRARAQAEFDGLAAALEQAGVEVLRLDDQANPPKPDAVFPNNWVSLHADGTAILYPLAAASRRAERRPQALEGRLAQAGYAIDRWIDLTHLEGEAAFLESTGSLVLDRPGRTAYACVSPRTSRRALDAFAEACGYAVHPFEARDRLGRAIYHTNVVLSLGARVAIACLEVVPARDRRALRESLTAGGREIVEVTEPQMSEFCANVLELQTRSGGSILAMSSRAFAALRRLAGPIVHAPIPTIETVGGGGVRCMLMEAPLPRRSPSARERATAA
jgi:hypothetical protein